MRTLGYFLLGLLITALRRPLDAAERAWGRRPHWTVVDDYGQPPTSVWEERER